jgi:TonB family protein
VAILGSLLEPQMRKMGLTLAMLGIAAGTVWARQEFPPSTADGPLNFKPYQTKPDKDGAYSPGPGIMLPIVILRAPAVYPADAADAPDAPSDAIDGVSVLSGIIGADGTPSSIEVVRSHGDAFDSAAIEAVKQSKFAPGNFDGRPVPVRVFIRVRFFGDRRPAYPRVAARSGPSGDPLQSFGGNSIGSKLYDQPPIATYAPNPSFSEEARRKKIQGVVIISLLVTEDGLPTELRVEKSVGYGLDQKAMEAVSHYNFKPAMKDGAPVAARISVETSFRLR